MPAPICAAGREQIIQTNHPVVGTAAPGTKVALIGRNADGAWLQLATSAWIAALLVCFVSS